MAEKLCNLLKNGENGGSSTGTTESVTVTLASQSNYTVGPISCNRVNDILILDINVTKLRGGWTTIATIDTTKFAIPYYVRITIGNHDSIIQSLSVIVDTDGTVQVYTGAGANNNFAGTVLIPIIR